MTALIVDDEPSAIADLKNVLVSIEPEAKIMTADVADDALNICREHDFDVVFMDINMPVMDGVAATALIKKRLPDIKIIMLYNKTIEKITGGQP